jgi:hypothetical protein
MPEQRVWEKKIIACTTPAVITNPCCSIYSLVNVWPNVATTWLGPTASVITFALLISMNATKLEAMKKLNVTKKTVG